MTTFRRARALRNTECLCALMAGNPFYRNVLEAGRTWQRTRSTLPRPLQTQRWRTGQLEPGREVRDEPNGRCGLAGARREDEVSPLAQSAIFYLFRP